MYNYNYEDENTNYIREPSQRPNYLSQSVNDIYRRDRRYFPITNYKNIESNVSSLNRAPDLISPIKLDSNPLRRSPKSQRFQNENATIYRVSPYHYQYISRLSSDNSKDNIINNYKKDYNYQEDNINGDQSYNIERERKFKNYNQYIDSRSINRHLNYLERNDNYKKDNRINRNFRNYNQIQSYGQIKNNNYNLRQSKDTNIKYQLPNSLSYRENRNKRYSDYNNEIPFPKNEQIDNRNFINSNNFSTYNNYRNNYNDNNNQNREENKKFIMKRNNSDLDFVNNNNYNNDRFLQNERYRNQIQREYEQNDNYENMEKRAYNEKRNYYSPEKNDYKGSRYGDYIYNYYLNSPMRGDISEDWRFPPIYYYRPNKNLRKSLYSKIIDENEMKEKFFNENI